MVSEFFIMIDLIRSSVNIQLRIHWLLVKIFRRFKFRINTQAQPNYPTVT